MGNKKDKYDIQDHTPKHFKANLSNLDLKIFCEVGTKIFFITDHPQNVINKNFFL